MNATTCCRWRAALERSSVVYARIGRFDPWPPRRCNGIFVRSISKSTVHRWLSQADLKPHRVRRWLHSPDPEFRAKVRRIVRLYLRPPRPSGLPRGTPLFRPTFRFLLRLFGPATQGVKMRAELLTRRPGPVAQPLD